MLRWRVVCLFGRSKMIDSSLHVSNEESDTADWLPNSFLRFFQQDLNNIPVKLLGTCSELSYLLRTRVWPDVFHKSNDLAVLVYLIRWMLMRDISILCNWNINTIRKNRIGYYWANEKFIYFKHVDNMTKYGAHFFNCFMF